jgi:hypothetical protein
MRFATSLFALSLTALVGCSTMQISVHTNPSGADVYGRPVGNGEYVHLGKTPLYLSNLQLDKEGGGAGPYQMEVRMEGYKTDDFVITETAQVNLHINRDLKPKRDLEMQVWLNQHISQMLEVRQLVSTNRYKEALHIIQRLKDQTPMVATLHQMEGGVQLLLRDYAAALQAYRTAARLDPENVEAIKLVRHLEKTYGFRREVDILDSTLIQERDPAAVGNKNAPAKDVPAKDSLVKPAPTGGGAAK